MATQAPLRRVKRVTSAIRNPEIRTASSQSQTRSQTFTLPDGRRLGFAEYGQPSGRPLLFFHGYPSSRLEAEAVHDIAHRCGIRLLALDRPGYGLSTPQPNRTIVDWPKDVRAFAIGIGLDRFAIMGGSGGGPFALACAHLLPNPMISSVGLFASAGPWEAGPQHMSWARRMMSLMSVYWPSGLQVLLTILVRGLRLIATSGPAIKRIDAWLEAQDKKAQLNRKDEEVTDENSDNGNEKKSKKTIEERRNYLLQLLIDEPFAQSVDATVLEARLLTAKSWGFKFENVEFNPVRIWHGTKDANSPIAAIRYLARRLPYSVLREYENDTHYTMAPHLEEALKELAEDFDRYASKTSREPGK